MTALELLEAMGYIRESYVLESEEAAPSPVPRKTPAPKGAAAPIPFSAPEKPGKYVVKQTKKKKSCRFPALMVLAATAALLLLTPTGQGRIHQWTEHFSSFIEKQQRQEQYVQPTEEVSLPAFSTSPVTINGYELQDGANLSVQVTMALTDVIRGEDAYQLLLSQNSAVPAPDDSHEYIIATLQVTYDSGTPDTLSMEYNQGTMMGASRFFHLPSDEGNSADVTEYLTSSVYDLALEQGQSGTSSVAFLQVKGNTHPLYFVGFGEVASFALHAPAADPGETISNVLFDQLFLPGATGQIGAAPSDFRQVASTLGCNSYEENGNLIIQNSQFPEQILCCLLQYTETEPQVKGLLYTNIYSGDSLRVLAKIENSVTVYYLDYDGASYGAITTDPEDAREYLAGGSTRGKPADEDKAKALALFENIFVPMAEGTIPNQADAFWNVLNQYGYLFENGNEGMFQVRDPSVRGCYLGGDVCLLNDDDTIPNLYFSMETASGTRSVGLRWNAHPELCLNAARVDDPGSYPVSDLQQLRFYLTQDPDGLDPMLYEQEVIFHDEQTAVVQLYGYPTSSYLYGVNHVRIRLDEQRVYDIELPEVLAEYWNDLSSAGEYWSEPFYRYTQSPTIDGGLRVEDVNFDGYADIGLQVQSPAYNRPYVYWVFDPDANEYRYLGSFLSFLEIDPASKTCTVEYREAQTYYSDVYEPYGKSLALKDRWVTEYIGGQPVTRQEKP